MRLPHRTSVLALAVTFSLALTGCVGEASRPGGGRGAADPTPTRIVVMAPAAAEMLESLDALERVVGIGDFVQQPASITNLPSVGAYDSPNVERVLELEADLYVTTSSQAAVAAHERLETLGVRVLALDTSTYEGVFDSLAELGAVIGKTSEASRVADGMRRVLSSIAERAQGLPPRRVLFVVGRDPIYVAGPGSHIDEMIAMVSGRNVAHDASSTYERFSMEAVLERMPDVIVDTSDNREGAPRGRHAGHWAQWHFLPAVEQNRVYQVDPLHLVIPGIRLPEMTLLMGKLIHPEAFGEPTDGELNR